MLTQGRAWLAQGVPLAENMLGILLLPLAARPTVVRYVPHHQALSM
jgi:hypothetical protein